ncbi:hypothetical protein I6Z00_002179 [Vibrio parahaemolyticus]|nr:hypothetical protein [Vibrio parahaemolyticus]
MQLYENRPDVLEMVVDEDFLSSLKVQQVEYPFGLSKERFCYFDGVLIGCLSVKATDYSGYYEGLKVEHIGRYVVTLIPVIEVNEYLEKPTISSFISSLSKLLATTRGWDLICEASCDQDTVEEVENVGVEIAPVFHALTCYFKGENNECPTFIIRARNITKRSRGTVNAWRVWLKSWYRCLRC